jgi:hypothetical protein
LLLFFPLFSYSFPAFPKNLLVKGEVGAIVVPDPQVLVPRASRLFDEQVDLREEIRQLVEAVAHWCRRVQPKESVSVQSEAGP